MLSLLLDEQISHVVAAQVVVHRAEIPVISMRDWDAGRYLGFSDELLLAAAAADGLTLVTYDQWLWEQCQDWDWTDRIFYLRRAP